MSIKPLAWERLRDGDWKAKSVLGTFDVWCMIGGKWIVMIRCLDIGEKEYPDADAAKAFAQSYYETKIREALDE